MYKLNNPLYSGIGDKPFQPAAQTMYCVAENVQANIKLSNR